MKEKSIPIIKTLELLTIIVLYYIVGKNNLFLYVLSFSLYNIFISFFGHVSLNKKIVNLKDNMAKFKLFKMVSLGIIVISLLFLLLSIFISDITMILLNIDNTLLVFLFMGFSIMADPLIRIMAEYLENVKKNSNYLKIIDIYNIFNDIFILIVALFVFKIFNINNTVAVSLLYLPKMVVAITIILVICFMNIRSSDNEKTSYVKELKEIFKVNIYKSVITIVKRSYYYVSIIILYLVLGSRYGYKLDEVTKNITFIYFYGFSIVLYFVYLVEMANKKRDNDINVKNMLFNNFKMMLPVTIFLGIVSPLTCKIIFNEASYSIYLMMINVMAIFILLFDIVYENIKNKKIIYVGLLVGIITKIVLVIPLINAFFRMGYNLVYGDIFSSIIGLFISITIGYIYLGNIAKNKERYFEKVLDILFDNIIFCILLILVQFVVPITTDNYFKSWGLFILYGFISFAYVKFKRKKRG